MSRRNLELEELLRVVAPSGDEPLGEVGPSSEIDYISQLLAKGPGKGPSEVWQTEEEYQNENEIDQKVNRKPSMLVLPPIVPKELGNRKSDISKQIKLPPGKVLPQLGSFPTKSEQIKRGAEIDLKAAQSRAKIKEGARPLDQKVQRFIKKIPDVVTPDPITNFLKGTTKGLAGAAGNVLGGLGDIGLGALEGLGIGGTEDLGGNIGAGLAALGDALVSGGRGKSAFLGSILKTREEKRKEPFERFTIFQKMLASEIAQKNQALMQANLMSNRNIKTGIEQEKWDLGKPGSKQSKVLVDALIDILPPETARKIERSRKKYEALSPSDLKSLFPIKKGKGGKRGRPGMHSKVMANPRTFKTIGHLIPGATDEEKSKYLANLPEKDAQKLFKTASTIKRNMEKKGLDKKQRDIVARVMRNSTELLRTMLADAGFQTGSWDNIQIDLTNNKIFFVNPEDGKRYTLDPAGVQIPLIKGRIAFDRHGVAMKALMEGVYAPLRKADFGASQSAQELRNFFKVSGQDPLGSEAEVFGFIKGVTKKVANLVRYSNDQIRNSVGDGEHYIKTTNMPTEADFTGSVAQTPRNLATKTLKDLKEWKKKNPKAWKGNIPRWLVGLKNKFEEHGGLSGLFYLDRKTNRIINKARRPNLKDQVISPVSGKSIKRYNPIEKWGPTTWLVFVKDLPDELNVTSDRHIKMYLEKQK